MTRIHILGTKLREPLTLCFRVGGPILINRVYRDDPQYLQLQLLWVKQQQAGDSLEFVLQNRSLGEWSKIVHNVPLKVIFKRKNLCDGFLKDCLNFADDSIYFLIGKESAHFPL